MREEGRGKRNEGMKGRREGRREERRREERREERRKKVKRRGRKEEGKMWGRREMEREISEKEIKRRSSLCHSVCERHIGCDLHTISSMVSICSSVKRNCRETIGTQHHNICQGTDPPVSFPGCPALEHRVWE